MSQSYSGEIQVAELSPSSLLARREIRPLVPVGDVADAPTAVANAFTLPFAWPNRTKGGIFRLTNFQGIRPDWNVFVSAGEAKVLGDRTAGNLVGNARFTVTGVAPGVNELVFGVAIEDFNGVWPWPGGPLPLNVDFFVVPK